LVRKRLAPVIFSHVKDKEHELRMKAKHLYGVEYSKEPFLPPPGYHINLFNSLPEQNPYNSFIPYGGKSLQQYAIKTRDQQIHLALLEQQQQKHITDSTNVDEDNTKSLTASASFVAIQKKNYYTYIHIHIYIYMYIYILLKCKTVAKTTTDKALSQQTQDMEKHFGHHDMLKPREPRGYEKLMKFDKNFLRWQQKQALDKRLDINDNKVPIAIPPFKDVQRVRFNQLKLKYNALKSAFRHVKKDFDY
ncbi:hypothetical protein RFI_17800, partial [Reticulomyxa filosa]